MPNQNIPPSSPYLGGGIGGMTAGGGGGVVGVGMGFGPPASPIPSSMSMPQQQQQNITTTTTTMQHNNSGIRPPFANEYEFLDFELKYGVLQVIGEARLLGCSAEMKFACEFGWVRASWWALDRHVKRIFRGYVFGGEVFEIEYLLYMCFSLSVISIFVELSSFRMKGRKKRDLLKTAWAIPFHLPFSLDEHIRKHNKKI